MGNIKVNTLPNVADTKYRSLYNQPNFPLEIDSEYGFILGVNILKLIGDRVEYDPFIRFMDVSGEIHELPVLSESDLTSEVVSYSFLCDVRKKIVAMYPELDEKGFIENSQGILWKG